VLGDAPVRRLPARVEVKVSTNICIVTFPPLSITSCRMNTIFKNSVEKIKMYVINACVKTSETLWKK
jgi:hypothetical protein